MVAQQKKLLDRSSNELTDSPFLRACRLEKGDYTPIWLMRQAGRFLPEYRAIRSKLGFLELCKRSDVAAEVTTLAVELLGVDAAIIFADILLVLEPMGIGLEFAKGDGPVIHSPVREASDVDSLKPVDPESQIAFMYEAIRLARRALKSDIPLIGFAGAPFTLASYLIEGGSSRQFARTKQFMYCHGKAWNRLMSVLSTVTIKHLREQIKAGVQAVQLFDSWVGCLSNDDYQKYVMPHVSSIVSDITPEVPFIYFGTDTATLLPLMRETGPHVLGLDWRVDLKQAWTELGHDLAIQGNLDPAVLLAGKEEITAAAKRVLEKAEARPGHIFNLGHGVLPQTPVDNVRFLVETVHQLSAR